VEYLLMLCIYSIRTCYGALIKPRRMASNKATCVQLLQTNCTIGAFLLSGSVFPRSSKTSQEMISLASQPRCPQYGQSSATPFSLKNCRAFSFCSWLSTIFCVPFLALMLRG
jgi:hypothetical protein